MGAGDIVFNEKVAAFSSFEEAQIKRQLGTGTRSLELVEQFLVVNGL